MLDLLNDGGDGCIVSGGLAAGDGGGDPGKESAGGVSNEDGEGCGAEDECEKEGEEVSAGSAAVLSCHRMVPGPRRVYGDDDNEKKGPCRR